jgi:hypothetical protein
MQTCIPCNELLVQPNTKQSRQTSNNEICIEKYCEEPSKFNYKNNKNPIYCKNHKKENMVNTSYKLCNNELCLKVACYNFPGMTFKFCKEHGEEGMVDVRSKHCASKDCYKRANFNYMKSKNPLYCGSHKEPDMIDIKTRRCKSKDCNLRPNYNYFGQITPLYCKEHRLEDMVDISHKKCEFEDCQVRPIYNYPNDFNAMFCKKHMKEGMIDVTCKRCDTNGCNERAYYNFVNDKLPRFCKIHRKMEMEDKTHTKCLTSLCDTAVTAKYRGYCLFCFSQLFPEENNSRNYKTKERSVVESVLEAFSDLSWVADKRVEIGCSRRRPDLFIDMGSHVIVIEVDENQHQSYDTMCESKRIMEISQDIQHRPLVCIRFNPDKYYIGSSQKMSCWKIDSYGVCVLKNNNEWNTRLNKLHERIRFHLNNITEKTINFEYLFYDTR